MDDLMSIRSETIGMWVMIRTALWQKCTNRYPWDHGLGKKLLQPAAGDAVGLFLSYVDEKCRNAFHNNICTHFQLIAK